MQKRILIADDDREMATLLASHCRMLGLEAETAHDSLSAFKLLNQHSFDLVCLDVNMPGGNGLNLCEMLLSDESWKATPFIVLTGRDDPETIKRCHSVCAYYVQKCTDVWERIEPLMLELVYREGAATHVGTSPAAPPSPVSADVSALPMPGAAFEMLRGVTLEPMSVELDMLLQYATRSDTSIGELATAVEQHPKFRTQLLSIMNGRMGTRRGSASNVLDAVRMLGVSQTVSFLLQSTALNAQGHLTPYLSPQFCRWLAARSVMVSSMAHALTRTVWPASAELARFLGQIQDIGMFVMACQATSRYSKVASRLFTKECGHLHDYEREEFGVTHAEVSAAFLTAHGLPRTFAQLVLQHASADPTRQHPTNENHLQFALRSAEAAACLFDRYTPQRHSALQRVLAPCAEAERQSDAYVLNRSMADAQERATLFRLLFPDEAYVRCILERYGGKPAEGLANISSWVPQSAFDGAIPKPRERARSTQFGDERPATNKRESLVLVIDDDPAIIQIISQYLAPLKCNVVACESFAEAAPAPEGLAAVLCDIHLNGENGIEVVKHLRSQGVSCPVIMMSGDSSRDTVMACLLAGINDFLVKPFARHKLWEKLREHSGITLDVARREYAPTS
jgi:CheY-like chemotaxis protein